MPVGKGWVATETKNKTSKNTTTILKNTDRVKQVIYDSRYSVENRYSKYGSLAEQVDVLTGRQLMVVNSWNLRGQELVRKFNVDINGNTDMYSEMTYYPSTGQVSEIRNYSAPIGNNNTNGLEKLNYQYDVWGNITRQELDRANTGANHDASAVETLNYDKLHRLTGVTQGIQNKTYQYDVAGLGNIKVKSDFGNDYLYGTTGTGDDCSIASPPVIGSAGPNAVTQVSLINGQGTMRYNYDVKGNRVQDCLNNSETGLYTYDYNNLLIESVGRLNNQQNDQRFEFNYGPDNQRYRKYDLANNEITLYANKDYEQIFDAMSAQVLERKYYLTSYLTITRDRQNRSKINFMQMDRLGSTTQIVDEDGIVLHTKGYDAFGKPRKGDWSDYGLFESKLDFTDVDENGGVLGSVDISKRGFTNHEHLDEMQLIHMNGRMYDYNNGRFLSVDPFIQAPTSTQSMNPYTYIFNNPLSGTDPTGYLAEFILNQHLEGKGVDTTQLRNAQAEVSVAIASAVVTAIVIADEVSDYIAPVKGIIKNGVKQVVKQGVKQVKKALKNGNKNKSQTSTNTKNKDVSNTESQETIVGRSEGYTDKDLENVDPKTKARFERLNKNDRSGQDFTPAGKENVKDINKELNGGKLTCEGCKKEALPSTQSKKGVTPSKREANVDHIERKRDGGSGTPDNGQVLCRECNIDEKH